MMRRLRTGAAVLTVVALAAMLPAPCPCAPQRTSQAKGHECCAPPTGVRALDHGCCDAVPSLDVAQAAPAPAAAAPAVAAVLPSLSLGAPAAILTRTLRAAVSPPPLVLRI